MSAYLQQVADALRELESAEPTPAMKIACYAVRQELEKARPKFKQEGDRFLVGTEEFKPLDGFLYYRAILMRRRRGWHPDAGAAGITCYEVYTASQPSNEPDHGQQSNTPWTGEAVELREKAAYGRSLGQSHQPILDYEWLRSMRAYIHLNRESETHHATENLHDIERHMRHFTPHHRKRRQPLEGGDLDSVWEKFISEAFHHGWARPLRGQNKRLADVVRRSCKYARQVLRKNPQTVAIADHLKEKVKVGTVCAYLGSWCWEF